MKRQINHRTRRLLFAGIFDFILSKLFIAALVCICFLAYMDQILSYKGMLITDILVVLLAATFVGTDLYMVRKAKQSGMLIRSRRILNILCDVQVIIVEAHGIITKGKLCVMDVTRLQKISRDRVIQLAASIVIGEKNPDMRAILQIQKKENIELLDIMERKSYTGEGVVARIDKMQVFVGNYKLLDRIKVVDKEGMEIAHSMQVDGRIPLFVGIDGKLSAIIQLGDELDLGKAEAIKKLNNLNIDVYLSGINLEDFGKKGTQRIRIKRFLNKLSDVEKSSFAEKLQSKGKVVLTASNEKKDWALLMKSDVSLATSKAGSLLQSYCDVLLCQSGIDKFIENIIMYKKVRKAKYVLSVIILCCLVMGILWADYEWHG